MKYLKRFYIICFVFLIIKKTTAKVSSLYSQSTLTIEQIDVINNAYDHPDFLIGDQLKNINPKKFISTNFNTLQLNIYLSGLSKVSYNIENPLNKNKPLHLANYYQLEALNYCYKGLYSLAIVNFEKSLLVYTALKDFNEIAKISQNLANLYLLKNNLKKAEEYNNISLIHYKLLNNSYKLINCVVLKAQLALLSGDFKKAENFILKNALLLSYQSGSKKSEQGCYYELGKIYLKNRRYTESKWFLIQSITLADKLNLKVSKIKSLLLLAKVKNSIKDHSLALSDLLLVKKMSDISTKDYQSDLQLELAQTYSYLNAVTKANQSLLSLKTLKNGYLLQNINP